MTEKVVRTALACGLTVKTMSQLPFRVLFKELGHPSLQSRSSMYRMVDKIKQSAVDVPVQEFLRWGVVFRFLSYDYDCIFYDGYHRMCAAREVMIMIRFQVIRRGGAAM